MAYKVSDKELIKSAQYNTSKYKRYWEDGDFELLYINYRDNVLKEFEKNLMDPRTDPTVFSKWTQIDKNLKTPKDIIKWAYGWLDYIHQIKTKEEYEKQLKRCQDILYYGGMELPIILMFDYQMNGIGSLFNKPTFYSYFDPAFKTTLGEGSYFIAFPSSIVHLNDEELEAVIKHEFGHITQGHCGFNSKDPFECNYLNSAMDISINLAFAEKEQELLISAAHKLFGGKAYPCLSLIGSKEEGGMEIDQPTLPGDWQTPLDFIRLYYKKDQKQGEGEGQGEPQKIDETINVGDFVTVRGKDPKVYGRVMGIDSATGEMQIEEYTKEEFDIIVKQ